MSWRRRDWLKSIVNSNLYFAGHEKLLQKRNEFLCFSSTIDAETPENIQFNRRTSLCLKQALRNWDQSIFHRNWFFVCAFVRLMLHACPASNWLYWTAILLVLYSFVILAFFCLFLLRARIRIRNWMKISIPFNGGRAMRREETSGQYHDAKCKRSMMQTIDPKIQLSFYVVAD